MSQYVIVCDREVDKEVYQPVTVSQLVWLTACLVLEDRITVDFYCYIMHTVADQDDAAEVIIEAGCIPTLAECLRHWSADAEAVHSIFTAFFETAKHHAVSLLTAINSTPGLVDMLVTVDASGVTSDEALRDYASYTLDLLGFPAVAVS